jgi:hypothetical protein
MFKGKIYMYRNPDLDPFHVQKISAAPLGQQKIVFKLGFITFKMIG